MTRGPGKEHPNLKLLKGTGIPCREKDNLPVEFDPVLEVPQPPPGLNEHGIRIWTDVAKQIFGVGLLHQGDVYALEQLAFSWQKFKEKTKANEALSPAENTSLNKLLSSFGMTPASRSKLRKPDNCGKGNPFGKFTKQK